MKIKKVYQSSASAFKFENFQDFTPTIENATVTYTSQYGKYKHLDENTIMGFIVFRGSITAVGNPAYATINLNIPNFSSINIWASMAVLMEAGYCTNETPFSVNFTGGSNTLTIESQNSGGTGACTWKTSDNIYIKIGFIANKE